MKTARKLLVEGRDDQHVIMALLMHHDFPQVFDVEDKRGVDNLLATFPVQIKGSNIETCGIVLDADIDATSRWNTIRASIERLGYRDCPDRIPHGGLVLSAEDLPRFGVWIMPDNVASGMLEDFVSFLVPEDDPLWSYCCDTISAMPAEMTAFKSIHMSKARIHTWLAWQADPGTPLGQAITKKYLRADSETAKTFIAWLHSLFVEA